MGTFSEGQLSRVTPAAMDVTPAPRPTTDNENGGDTANITEVASAMEAAEAAAKAAEAAVGEAAAAATAAALFQAREALKSALTRAGAGAISTPSPDDDDDEYMNDGATTDDDDSTVEGSGRGGGTGPISEFGLTWMMLDGWVTRATFHYLTGGAFGGDTAAAAAASAKEAGGKTEAGAIGVHANEVNGEGGSGEEGERGDRERDAGGDESGDAARGGGVSPPAPDVPPRSGFAVAMSNAAAVEITRALPAVCRALGLRATPSALERPLGKLLRTFFFQAAVPSLRPERWALVTAVMLEVAAVRGIVPGEPDDRSPTLAGRACMVAPCVV